MVEAKPVVLITGVSGYIGAHVCNYFLKDGGFTVRGTVRDANNEGRIAPLRKAFGADFERLELRNADLLDGDSLDKAIEGATYVVHTASPFHFKAEKLEDIITPAVEGTLNALRASAKHQVKRVVITSSRAAISFGHEPPYPVYDENNWSDIEVLTKAGVSYAGGYMLSKTLAEKAAWDFQRDLPAANRFELASVNPCLVVGPAFVGSGFTSGNILESWMTGNNQPGTGNMTLVDVRQVAEAHLNAIKIPGAAGQRFSLINGNFSLKECYDALYREFAHQGWPINNTVDPKKDTDRCSSCVFDTTRSQQVLQIEYEQDIGKVLIEMAYSMINTGALKKPAASSVETMKEYIAAIGPYSAGKIVKQVGVGTWGYGSGQVAMNPETGELVGTTAAEQAEQALKNLQQLATINGFEMDGHTIKNVVFLTDMSHFAEVNEVYANFYPNNPPARSCVAVAGLPKGALFEIESVFFKP